MAYNVRFLKGTPTEYSNLVSKDANTFYFTGTDLYLGTIKLSNASDLNAAAARIAANESAISTIQIDVGDKSNLTTTAKTDLVSAINEVKTDAANAVTSSTVTISESSSQDYAKVYTLSQGGSSIGTINIPKDMVVSSGDVEVDPQGQAPGTYLVLTLANATSDKVYINVGSLVDIYTVEQNATQIQLAISNNVISASVVAGSITATELAANSVTTAKIVDGNVTYAKLASSVQTSLGLADSAVQSVTTGTTNGTISVDGSEVAVAGLQDAAYTTVSSLNSTASSYASTAEANAKAYTDTALTWGVIT